MNLFKHTAIVILLGSLAWWPMQLTAPTAVAMCPMGMTASEMTAMSAMGSQEPAEPSQEAPPSQEPPPTTPGPPEEDPEAPPGGHVMPTEFCTPYNRSDGKMPCMCTMSPEGMAGCKEGRREAEVRHCNSWCWKQFCSCCAS